MLKSSWLCLKNAMTKTFSSFVSWFELFGFIQNWRHSQFHSEKVYFNHKLNVSWETQLNRWTSLSYKPHSLFFCFDFFCTATEFESNFIKTIACECIARAARVTFIPFFCREHRRMQATFDLLEREIYWRIVTRALGMFVNILIEIRVRGWKNDWRVAGLWVDFRGIWLNYDWIRRWFGRLNVQFIEVIWVLVVGIHF